MSAQIHLPVIWFDAMRGIRPTALSVHKRAPTTIGALLLFRWLDLSQEPDIKRCAFDAIYFYRQGVNFPDVVERDRLVRRCACLIRMRLNHSEPYQLVSKNQT